MVRLSNFFKKDDMSDLFYEDYFKAVGHLTDSQFTRAIEHLIKSHQSGFFPVPAELLKAVDATREMVQITPKSNRLIEQGVPCPPEIRESINQTMEKIKKRSA